MPDLIKKITRSIPFARSFTGLLILALAPLSADPNASLSLLQAVKNQDAPAIAPTATLDMLALLYYGADGRTATQLGALFGGASQQQVADTAAKAQRQLPGYQRIGSVWFSERVAVTPEFLQAVDSQWKFYTGAAPLRTDPAKAASQINFYYEQQTSGHIKNVISARELVDQPDMLAVIVSAFVSNWATPFDAGKTRDDVFYRSGDEKFYVKMMSDVRDVPYFADDTFQVAALDVQAKDFSVMFFLPQNARQFDAALSTLNGAYLLDVQGKLKKQTVKLSLPRVNFSNTTNWRDVFAKSKLADPFTPGKANFSRINANQPEPLYISHLIEETQIKWNEVGIEARSASKAIAGPFGEIPSEIEFKANHPFIFVIYNKQEQDVAFAGIIQSKTQMSGQ